MHKDAKRKPEEYKKKIPRISRSILECARISLLIFIQIDKLIGQKEVLLNIKKDDNLRRKAETTIERDRKQYFISIIDDALLERKIYLKLKKFIKNNCKIYL